MSHIDDVELRNLIRDGAKLSPRPNAVRPAEPAPKPSDAALIVGAIQNLTKQLAAQRPMVSPDVNVAAPSVSVKPQITVERAEEIEAEVTEWTREGRIKKMKFRVVK